MKKLVFLGLLLFIIVGGCTKEAGEAQVNDQDQVIKNVDEFKVSNSSAEVKQGDFVYRLVSEKEEYKGKEPVKLYATLEYVGDLKEVTLFHGFTPLSFQLFEKTRSYRIDQAMPAILKSAVYKRGEPVRTDYTKSGGYGETDSKAYASFIKDSWENGLPTGYYVVDGSAQFYTESPIGDNPQKNNIVINAQVEFKVAR